MMIDHCPVQNVEQVADNVFIIRFVSAQISRAIQPGQFLNIRLGTGTDPLLRRPFSAHHVDGEDVEIIFNVVGKGSQILQRKKRGDRLDVLGPLGKPFSIDSDAFDTGVLVGGGLGVAPLPLITNALRHRGKRIETYLGARTQSAIVDRHLANLHIATDDGSSGFSGNVIDLLKKELHTLALARPMIFACGPTPMLRAVSLLAQEADVPCEVSLEGPMACGFGICQGCAVERIDGPGKYALVCKDGPTFDARKIKI